MSAPPAYTPLESLFLFQSLLTQGIDTAAFARISDVLKNNALIKGGESYDPSRLAPDALQKLFLLLLKEEVKCDSDGGKEGGSSPNSKKRKVASPTLPTLKDASEYIEKLPLLVDRLYARYRDHVVKQIREDEKSFETVQKQIQLLERSEKERLARSASQGGNSALSRDPRAALGGSNSPSPSPAPPPGVLAGIKRGPGGATPSHLQAIRPSISPKPTGSGFQPPPGVASQKPVLSPKPDGTDPNSIKWEKPYSPLQPAPGRPISPATPGQMQRVPPAQTALSGTTQRPIPGKPTGMTTQPGPQPIQPRPSAAPIAPGRPIQPQPPRPIAAAPPDGVPAAGGGVLTPTAQKFQPGQPPKSIAMPDKPFSSPYGAHQPHPAIPEHMIRQAAGTPGQAKRPAVSSSVPHTPAPTSPVALTRGFGTKWASQSTPSTPGPIMEEPESPAFEPVSPPQRSGSLARGTSKSISVKGSPLLNAESAKSTRGRASRSRGRAVSNTPSVSGARRSQSVASQPDELSIDSGLQPKIKNEQQTPRLHDETGDTTADESVHGRGQRTTPRAHKRKRQETPPEPPSRPSHVLWTRGFTKVSSSALDQISSHRDANMFATALKEKDAPGYRQVVLQPQDITSIRAAIKHGNKAAVQAAANLPDGDPGGPSVWLPIADDLVPPQSIINSSQLERELVHMFCNAIMYNPDPDRGFGPAFMKRSQDEEEEAVGYEFDENGIVRNTQGMFVEVEKLLSDLRAAEKDREPPPPNGGTQDSVAETPGPDDTAEEEDELAGDGDIASQVAKRRRIGTRS